MTDYEIMRCLNKMDSALHKYLEIIKKTALISYEDYIELKKSFEKECLEIFIKEIEKEVLDNSYLKSIRRILIFFSKEIYRLKYHKKWEREYNNCC